MFLRKGGQVREGWSRQRSWCHYALIQDTSILERILLLLDWLGGGLLHYSLSRHPALRALYVKWAESMPIPSFLPWILLQPRSNHTFRAQGFLNISLRDQLDSPSDGEEGSLEKDDNLLLPRDKLHSLAWKSVTFINHAGYKRTYIYKPKGHCPSTERTKLRKKSQLLNR